MNEITTRILKILVMVFAVVLASTIFYHLLFQAYETETAIYYEVRDVSAFQGVYIRDESPLTYNGTGAVRYCVEDGAKLGVGSVIAEVYASGDQIDLRRRIAAREEELAMLHQVENPGTSEHAQPANLAALIEEHYKSLIRFRERGELSAMAESKQDLTVLMSTYQKITDPDVDFQARIATLENEIASLSGMKTAPEQIIRADRSAYFVSYADGYEAILNTDAIRSMTKEQILAITDSDETVPVDEHAVGKLIDDYAWHIVGIFDNTKVRLSVDDMVTVRLESLSRNMSVQVESLYSTGDVTRTQAVFRCEQMTRDVVQHRTERVELLRDSVEGIRIPRSAIRFQNVDEPVLDKEGNPLKDAEGNPVTETVTAMGVYVLIGENAEFRKVETVYEDEEYYLSSLEAGSGYVSLYDDIIVKGVMADGV